MSEEENPYLAGRREWNERYGSYIAQRNQWRKIAFGALGVAALAVVGVVWIGAQSKLVPYVVEVNKLGEPAASRIASRAATADDRIIRAVLSRWVVEIRTVTADRELQAQFLRQAYALVQSSGSAWHVINEYFGNGKGPNSPLIRAAKETVAVEVGSVLRQSSQSWQLEWLERVRERSGAVTGTERWRALLTVEIQAPGSEEELRANPAGIRIRELSWQRL